MSHYEKIMRGECYYPEIYGFFDLVVDDQGVSALAAAEQDAPLGELMRRLQHETSTYRNFCHTWSLVEGARRGSLNAVRRLILVGADVHVIQVWDKEGSRTSPIEEAAKNGYLDIVRVLLEAEVQETERLDYSMKALERAVQKGDHHRVTLLLRGKDFAKRADQCKNEALQEADGLEITELLVEFGADIRAKPNLPHQSPLANAAKRGCLAAVEYFLDRGADVNYWGYKNQYTALENAASGGFLDIVDRLLEAGALVMVAMELHAACVDGHLPVVERLLELGVDPDDCEAEWRAEEFTPLQRAAYGGYLELVEVLLEAGADVNHPATYPEGRTALQAAAEKGSVAVVRRLMEADADVNAPAGALGRTALQAAAEAGSLEIVNMLLEAGANYSEFGSLALAIEGGHISVVTRLLELDLRANSDDSADSHDNDDNDDNDEINSAYIRALLAATESGWTGVVGRLLEMRTPPVPDIGTDEYTSLLSAAARTGSVDIVELFVKAGFDVDGDTNGHGTVLQNAVRHGHVETVRFLLTSGADANKADGRIKPPLHLACKKQNEEIVKLLVKAGANPYALSYTNRTARHTAEKHKCQKIVQLLKEAEATTTFKRETNLSPRDVSTISKKELCAVCKNLPFELFTVATQKSEHGETNWHPTLISLQMSVRDGCPFCMFFWKQFDTTEAEGMNIPRSSLVKFGRASKELMVCQTDEPYPKDIAKPKRPVAFFQFAVEPFQGKLKPLPAAIFSPETLYQLKYWLNRCSPTHRKCNPISHDKFVPTRLLDLTGWDKYRYLRLVESKRIAPRTSPYMTLSHLWSEITPSISTSMTNLGSRYIFISPTTLPPTYLHAIEITNALHVQYLWIDSLCIIQDSKEDWEHEHSLMHEIYRHSHCTIAANLSLDSEGLFHASDTSNDSIQFPCKAADGTIKLVRAMKTQCSWSGIYDISPLWKRGWPFVEREMSARIMHFTPREVLWECRVLKATQGLPTTNVWRKLGHEYRRLLDAIGAVDAGMLDVHDLWHRTVTAYSFCQLSHPEETLPALSSLVSIVAAYTNSEYVAGMWASDLKRSLMWATTTYRHNKRESDARHEMYIAPSWSWASVKSPKCFSVLGRFGRPNDRVKIKREDVSGGSYVPRIDTASSTIITDGEDEIMTDVEDETMTDVEDQTMTDIEDDETIEEREVPVDPHIATIHGYSIASNPPPQTSEAGITSIPTPIHTLHITASLLPCVIAYSSPAPTSRIPGIQMHDFTGNTVLGYMWFDVLSEYSDITVVRCMYLFDDPRVLGKGLGLALVAAEGQGKGVYRRVGHAIMLDRVNFLGLKRKKFVIV